MKFLEEIIEDELGIGLLPLEVAELPGTLLGVLKCRHDGGMAKILIRDTYRSEFEMIFVICHEMRHYWQILNGIINVQNYEKMNHNDYNSRDAEIDANAFAVYILIEYFDIKPSLDGLSEEVRQKTFKHMFEEFYL